MKIIKVEGEKEETKQAIIKEVAIMRKLTNTHLVTYTDFFEEKRLFYMVMSLGNWDNLQKFMDERNCVRMEERVILDIACQMIMGLNYLHSLKLLHKDINPQNIFILGNVVKIGDLSLSRYNLTVPLLEEKKKEEDLDAKMEKLKKKPKKINAFASKKKTRRESQQQPGAEGSKEGDKTALVDQT